MSFETIPADKLLVIADFNLPDISCNLNVQRVYCYLILCSGYYDEVFEFFKLCLHKLNHISNTLNKLLETFLTSFMLLSIKKSATTIILYISECFIY